VPKLVTLPGKLLALGKFSLPSGAQVEAATWNATTGWVDLGWSFDPRSPPDQLVVTSSDLICISGRFKELDGVTINPAPTGRTLACRTLQGDWHSPPSVVGTWIRGRVTTRDDHVLFVADDQTVRAWDGQTEWVVFGAGSLTDLDAAMGPDVYSRGWRWTEAPFAPADGDWDGDRATNADELLAGSDPWSPYSDADGIGDGDELFLGTDPLNPDTDGDGEWDDVDPCPTVDQASAEDTVELCNDGLDNDCDGYKDWWDRDCIGIACTVDGDPNDKCFEVNGTINGMGGCLGSGPINCNDINGCTIDTCDPAVGCEYGQIVCNDGNECTDDFCTSQPDPNDTTGLHPMGVCGTDGITPNGRACTDDGEACTTDTCFNGACVHNPDFGLDGLGCDDGVACTTAVCLQGVCTAQGPEVCDDQDACTADACIPGVGCDFAACDTGAGYTCGGGEPAGCNNLTDDTVHVPAGDFLMGCDPNQISFCQPDTTPLHTITLSAFEIDRYEVTVAEYDACVTAGACTVAAPNFAPNCPNDVAGSPNFPVTCVAHANAAEFCAWDGKRLCTEAEWEKAARGPDGRRFPPAEPAQFVRFFVVSTDDGTHTIYIDGTAYEFVASSNTTAEIAVGLAAAVDVDAKVEAHADGTTIYVKSSVGGETWTYDSLVPGTNPKMTAVEILDLNCSQANQRECGGALLPVGSKPAGVSLYGVHDMVGNAWEWVADYYDPSTYTTHATTDPTGPTSGTEFVRRGGDFVGAFGDTWSRGKSSSAPARTGFRCCR
jgi:formylglycine-generating enzyme required for sulfatase activity